MGGVGESLEGRSAIVMQRCCQLYSSTQHSAVVYRTSGGWPCLTPRYFAIAPGVSPGPAADVDRLLTGTEQKIEDSPISPFRAIVKASPYACSPGSFSPNGGGSFSTTFLLYTSAGNKDFEFAPESNSRGSVSRICNMPWATRISHSRSLTSPSGSGPSSGDENGEKGA